MPSSLQIKSSDLEGFSIIHFGFVFLNAFGLVRKLGLKAHGGSSTNTETSASLAQASAVYWLVFRVRDAYVSDAATEGVLGFWVWLNCCGQEEYSSEKNRI